MAEVPLSNRTLLFLQLLQQMREDGLPIPFDSIQSASLIFDGLDLLDPVGDDDEANAETAAFLAMGFDGIRQELEKIQHQEDAQT